MFEFNEERFADKLKKLIKDRGMTQKAFAEKCNMPENTLRSYLSGNNKIGIENAIMLAQNLEMSLDELLLEKQENTAKAKEITLEGIFDAINYLVDAFGVEIITQEKTPVLEGYSIHYNMSFHNDAICQYIYKMKEVYKVKDVLDKVVPDQYQNLLKACYDTDNWVYDETKQDLVPKFENLDDDDDLPF